MLCRLISISTESANKIENFFFPIDFFQVRPINNCRTEATQFSHEDGYFLVEWIYHAECDVISLLL